MKAYNRNRLAYLKAILKVHAATIKAIRCEKRRAPDGRTKSDLQYELASDGTSRTVRHLHLAYGFLRGRSYKDMEHYAHNSPYWPLVKKYIDKYGVKRNWSLPDTQSKELYTEGKAEQEERWKTWLQDAKAHRAGQKKLAA